MKKRITADHKIVIIPATIYIYRQGERDPVMCPRPYCVKSKYRPYTLVLFNNEEGLGCTNWPGSSEAHTLMRGETIETYPEADHQALVEKGG
jgi:hypothetical protein